MQLSSSFRNFTAARSEHPLSDDEIVRVAPSIFADGKHQSRSERYAYIPTSDVLKGLRNEDFQPFMVCQTRVRDDSRREHTKHMIRLRHASQITATRLSCSTATTAPVPTKCWPVCCVSSARMEWFAGIP
ncbi:protein of unknown function [Nitrosospira sp. Nsp13]|nr:protein of unknown function [Nitrosospira sp. Nsp13]